MEYINMSRDYSSKLDLQKLFLTILFEDPANQRDWLL